MKENVYFTGDSPPLSEENKSDISYLKTSRDFDVPIHSGKPNSVG